ncbi:hypothetical protein TRFO_09762 [Tritrichomonas foetus]|uniref:Uncharacterized protein n=1 Tax=Tritrichomonas foetus TaxID=1144522 RepID=A0A1J4JCD0_9EUKA|nr:hypothetical protein TRFO_09762 [Tritrichomonas foetus]|eukprot:OHS96858.1 hypothetical protein TRFO_09762 [Tritrichomonas foetus]
MDDTLIDATVDSVKKQFDNDLRLFIAYHEQQWKDQYQQFMEEKEELAKAHNQELEELKQRHKEELEHEKQLLERKRQMISEVKRLEAAALNQLPTSSFENYQQEDPVDSNSGQNSAFINENNNEFIVANFENEFRDILGKYHEIRDEMAELPEKSRNQEDYQKLLAINRKQLDYFESAMKNMRKRVGRESSRFNDLVKEMDDSFKVLFDTYKDAVNFKDNL